MAESTGRRSLVLVAAGVLCVGLAAGCSTEHAMRTAAGGEAAAGAREAAPPAPDPLPGVQDLPEGPASTVPWTRGRELHVGDATIRTRPLSTTYANGTTVAWRNRVDGSDLFLVDAPRLVPLVRGGDFLDVTLSADGQTVVWSSHVADDLRRVTAYDVGTRRPLGTIDVPVEPFCCTGNGELYVTSITDDGRVVWHTADRRPAVAWRPGEETTVPLRGYRPALSLGGWPGGLMWQGGGRTTFEAPGVLATVAEDGLVRRAGAVPTDHGRWSPDGSTFAYLGQEDGGYRHKSPVRGAWLQDVATRERVRLRVAVDDLAHVLGWESPETVVLTVPAESDVARSPSWVPQALVRCDATTGECERVAGFPTGPVDLPFP